MKISDDQNTITFPVLKAVESDCCERCYFNVNRAVCRYVPCWATERKNNKSVIFIEVENVKTEKEI